MLASRRLTLSRGVELGTIADGDGLEGQVHIAGRRGGHHRAAALAGHMLDRRAGTEAETIGPGLPGGADAGLDGLELLNEATNQPSTGTRLAPGGAQAEQPLGTEVRKWLSAKRNLVGPVGFEPTTNGLRVRCSTN